MPSAVLIRTNPLIVPHGPRPRPKCERSVRSPPRLAYRRQASWNKGSVSKVRPSSRSHRRVDCTTPRSNASRPRRRRPLKTRSTMLQSIMDGFFLAPGSRRLLSPSQTFGVAWYGLRTKQQMQQKRPSKSLLGARASIATQATLSLRSSALAATSRLSGSLNHFRFVRQYRASAPTHRAINCLHSGWSGKSLRGPSTVY